MKKSLEEFVKESRQAFDVRKIDPAVWNRVAGEMKNKNRKQGLLSNVYFKWGSAAAVLIFIAGALFFFTHDNTEKKVSGNSIMSEQYPEYDIKIKTFVKQIELKKYDLKIIANEQPEVYAQFVHDTEGLNNSYDELKNKLLINPNRNLLLTEMIENLELQIRLLNQQLELIKQLKGPTPKTNEKNVENI